MQANQISAGQLMMSFMSKAKDDIREGIAANVFSRELLAQCHTSDGTGAAQVPLQGSTALLGGDSRVSTSGHPAPLPPAEEPAVQELKPAGSSPARNAPSTTDRRISEVKVREALYVSDPMVVEKILAHFQLPAEARAVCAGSLNSRGGIPFNTIVAVLEQYNPGGASPQGEAGAGSQEVAEFVAALQLTEGLAPGILRGIPVKAKGSYSLKEFKLLMKKAVACVNEAELKKAGLRDSTDRNADKSGGSPAAAAVSSSASAPALAHGMSTQLVRSGPPLFMQPWEGKAHHDLWEPVQNAPSFPSPEEPSWMHDGTRIQATGDPASLVMEPAMGGAVKTDQSMETSPIPPPQVAPGDPEDDGLHQTKAHEVLQTLSASTASEEAAPYTQETVRPYHEQGVVVRAEETVSAKNPLEENGKRTWVEDLNVAQDSEIPSDIGLSQREVSTESGMETEVAVSFPSERWSAQVSTKVELEGQNPVEYQQPDHIDVAGFFHSRPSELFSSEPPRGKPIAPQGAPVVEGAERMADEQMPFQVSEKSSHERGHPETKRHDESAIWQRGPENFSESAPPDEPVAFSERQGNMNASSKDNNLDSLDIIPKREPGTLAPPRPDVEFPHSREGRSSEGPDVLSDMSGGVTEEHGTSSRLEKSPLGIDLAITSARSNTTFQDSDRNWKQSEDPPVAGVTALDETIPDEAAASPKAPDASAPRFALEASSSPLDPRNGVGDSLSLEDAGWPQELGQRLTQLRGKDGNRLTLELAPRHLGKLVIQVEAHRDQVIAWLSTDNEQARSLLVQNAPLLRQQLQEQGLVLGQLQVSVGQEGREKNSQQRFESSRGKGEGGRSIEKLQSSRRSGPTHAYRAADADRRISLFA